MDSPLGWRGCFFAPLPIAILAFAVLQKTLHLPVVKRPVKVDYAGATLIVGEVLRFHFKEGLVNENFHIDLQRYRPVARLAGSNYAKLGEVFSLKRPVV